jgi:CheY-like chemotaxis protein
MVKSAAVKILLADDSTHAQRMGAKILAGEGIEVVSVSNGEAAVKRLQDTDFDLVLADVYMPGLDGYEVCQWVKKSEAHTGLPVVLVVGALEIYEADRIEQVQADGLLKKPFEASAMLAALRPLLESSAASKPSRKKMEQEPAEPAAHYEKTVMIPAPAPAAPQKHEDTQEIEAKDQPAAAVEAPPPAPEPPPPAPEPPPPAPEPTPMPEPEPQPAFVEDPPPMAEMAVPVTAAAAAAAEEFPAMAEIEQHSFESETTGDFAIPDVTSHQEQSIESAPPQEPQWVAEPAQVTDEDRGKFEESAAAAASGAVVAPPVPEAPPDWGELLKSVEEGSGGLPAAAATAGTVPEAAAAPAAVHAAKEAAPSSDLVLEMAEPEPAPLPPPAIDEEELRMAVQLCLENALPGLVDEITAAVIRRIGHSG